MKLSEKTPREKDAANITLRKRLTKPFGSGRGGKGGGGGLGERDEREGLAGPALFTIPVKNNAVFSFRK
jgi:hypothetical protein